MTTANIIAAEKAQKQAIAANPALLVGKLVQVRGPADGCFGIAEYLTEDGWIGIRQPHAGNRIDEYPVSRVEIDPT